MAPIPARVAESTIGIQPSRNIRADGECLDMVRCVPSIKGFFMPPKFVLASSPAEDFMALVLNRRAVATPSQRHHQCLITLAVEAEAMDTESAVQPRLMG